MGDPAAAPPPVADAALSPVGSPFSWDASASSLFIPGWLRMLDLWLHTRRPGLTVLTAGPVQVFAWLVRRIPAVRRHGYLTVCVAERPA